MRRENPVVREAIIEVGFEAITKESIFSEYNQAVLSQYPNFTPIPQQTTTFEVGPNGVLPAQYALQQFVRYISSDRSAALTLSQNSLAFHILEPYPGWEDVSQRFSFAWGKVIETLQPNGVTQLSVRYINTIACLEQTETLDYWLKANEFLPPAILQSYPLSPCQIQKNTNGGSDYQRVTVQKIITGKEAEPEGVFVWEIGCWKTERLPASIEPVMQAVNLLHDTEQTIFDTAVGPNLDRLMNNLIIQ